MNKLSVRKRDGNLVPVRLDEITDRISSLSKDLDDNIIDPVQITINVVKKIHNKISTSKLDAFTADICHNKSIEHPHFNVLAGRLLVSDHHKNILLAANMKFSQVCQLLYNNTDQLGEQSPLISDELFEMSQEYSETIDEMIDYERDFLIDFFGFKTLYKAYLLKIGDKVVETPQDMFMRVALGIWGKFKRGDGTYEKPDFERIKETYDLLSTKFFTHATPTLYNSGTRRPQFFSCFLMRMDDSIESIFKVLSDCAQISKYSGGIGIHFGEVRADGSYIRGTGGRSDGIVPMLKVYNDTARYINQCFDKKTIIPTKNGLKRFDEIVIGDEVITEKGTVERVTKVFRNSNLDDKSLYGIHIKHSIEPTWVTKAHPMFCIKGQKKILNHKVIENRLNKDIIKPEYVSVEELQVDDFIGFSIPKYEMDIPEYTKDDCRFYGAMLGDGYISKDGSQAYICGNPNTDDFNFYRNYLIKCGCNLTTTDRDNNYRRLFFTTQVSGMFKFGRVHLYDHNDEKYVHPSFLHLPINKALQIVFGVLETDGHIGKDKKGTEIVLELTSKNIIDSVRYILLRAGVLTSGAIIDRIGETHETNRGTITTQKLAYRLRIPKTQIVCDLLGLKYVSERTNQFRYNDYIFSRITKFEKKLHSGAVYDLETSGPEHTFLTQLGVAHNGGGRRPGSFAMYLEPWHADIENFLKCKLNHGDENMRARDLFYALWIPDLFMERVKNDEYWSLMCPSECPGLCDVYGDEFKELYEKYESEGRMTKTIKAQDLFHTIVSSQIETGTPYMVYKDHCNKKSNQKNIGTIRSSNLCAEIVEYSDTKKTACCVLASVVLPSYVYEIDGVVQFDHKRLFDVVQVVTRNLNRVIDINYYPTEETKRSNFSERPIGIGVQGLADVFFKLHLPYDSEEALHIDREIFETIYFAALTQSCELAKKDGPYETYEGSPISQGLFQFDLWKEYSEKEPKLSGRWDWEKLRNDIKQHGVRNSLVTALMPTASTSQIMGSTAEAFEPITSNCYTRRTKAGEFMLINKYMAQDLINEGLWSENMRGKLLNSRGSIQNIKGIPQKFKDIYKTVWELKQKVLIDHSIERGLFVDQSQSLNLFFEETDIFNKISTAHFYGWKNGLKTGSYYIRSKPAVNSISFTKDDSDSEEESDSEESDRDSESDREESEHEEENEIIEDDCEACGA